MATLLLIVVSLLLASGIQGTAVSNPKLRAEFTPYSPRSLKTMMQLVGISGICQHENNYDFVGNDLTSKPGKLEECCDMCSGVDRCRGFSWTNLNGGTCWFKSGRGKVVWNTNVVSGIVIPQRQPVCYHSIQEQNTDFVGNDIGSVSGSEPDACCEPCWNTPNCRAFSWSSGTCWLKSGVNRKVVSAGVVSAEAFAQSISWGNCGLEQGVDYVGNDIGSASNVGDAGNCCDRCTNTPGCKAFSWTNTNGGTCWFKNWKGDTVANPNVVSAYMYANPMAPVCTLELDINYVGNDIGSSPSADAYGCCSICLQTSGCTAFSWNGGTCYLKSDIGTKSSQAGFKSSYVRSRYS